MASFLPPLCKRAFHFIWREPHSLYRYSRFLPALQFTEACSKGHFSTLPPADPPTVTDEFRLVYEGPLTKSVKLIKVFSLTTAAASLVGGPVLVLFGKDSVSAIGKLFLAGTVVLMGVSTTILLHWVTRVYAHKIYFHPQTRTFAAETLSFFARTQTRTFSVEDVIVPEVESAFSTFEANGKKYFIHMELKEAQQILNYVKEYNMENMMAEVKT